MKIRISLILLLFPMLSFGQFKDLANLAEGTIVYQDILYDSDDKLYGYIYLYERDVNEKTTTMEYVLLDKNLNKVSNQVFKSNNYKKVSTAIYDCNLLGDNIIFSKYYYYIGFFDGASPLLTTFQSLSIKDNTVSPEYTYKDSTFVEFKADFEQMKNEYKNLEKRTIIRTFDINHFRGFYIREDIKNKEYLEKELRFYDDNRKQLWSYKYNNGTTSLNYQTFSFISAKDTCLYLLITDWKKAGDTYDAKPTNYVITCLNIKTGKEIYKYLLETSTDEYNHSIWADVSNGELTVLGPYKSYKKGFFGSNPNLGFYRLTLDRSGKEKVKTYTKWSDFAPQITIDQKAKVDGLSNFRLTKAFFFKNGNITLLAEKYKIYGNYNTYNDFILFNMTPEFKLDTILKIKKGAGSLGGDFLFAQYIKDDAGVVFFHQDIIDGVGIFSEKTLFLGINTLIDGKLTEEKIPLSQKKKFFIRPYPAKEGYIMLREYNEKEKYNQIRLERLNY